MVTTHVPSRLLVFCKKGWGLLHMSVLLIPLGNAPYSPPPHTATQSTPLSSSFQPCEVSGTELPSQIASCPGIPEQPHLQLATSSSPVDPASEAQPAGQSV